MIHPLFAGIARLWTAQLPSSALVADAYLFETEDGLVVADPLPVDDETDALFDAERPTVVIVLSRDRLPYAEAMARRFGAKLVSNAVHREDLFAGARAIALRGGGFALNITAHRAILTGDRIHGTPVGELTLKAGTDPLALRALLRAYPRALLPAYGYPIVRDAYDVLYRLLYRHAGAEVHRINIDELDFRRERYERNVQPPEYECSDAEVGWEIGARALGYRVTTLDPGKKFCPMHAHAREEELFFVLDGEPSVRMLSGTLRCRKGDFVAMPVGVTGTHQLLNESDAPATVLLIGRTEMPETRYYPDSDKILVDGAIELLEGRGPGVMVRGSPDLDYFEGE